jgi:hypothetical protein
MFHKNSICIPFLPMRFACFAHLIFLDSIMLILNEAPHCVVSSNLLLLNLSSVQLFSSAPCSQTPSVYVR